MLRLKEKPSEWIKFVAVMGVSLNLLVWFFWWSGAVPLVVPLLGLGLAFFALGLAGLRPRWFRGFYRGGMTLSYYFGQLFGKLVLFLFFFLLMVPMGLLLRLMGKDLLRLKRSPESTTHWHPAKSNREFDRMF